MKIFLKLLVIPFASLIFSGSPALKAAAEQFPTRSYTPVAGAEPKLPAWIIQNYSDFPIAIDYVPAGATKSETAYLPEKSAPEHFHKVLRPKNIRSNIQIRIGAKLWDEWKSSLSGLLSRAIPAALFQQTTPLLEIFTKGGLSIPEDSVKPLMQYILAQKITIQPIDFRSGIFLAFWWPVTLAAKKQPPIIVPLSDLAAVIAWRNIQNQLDEVLQPSESGLHAYEMFRKYITYFANRKQSLNSERVHDALSEAKQRPSGQPQLEQPTVQPYDPYEIFQEYEQPQ